MTEFLQLLLLILVLTISVGGIRLAELPGVVGWARRTATRPSVVVALVGVVTYLGCLMVANFLHEPIPRVHDEFSYLLISDTLTSARVSNPSPPLPEFFDTFHVLMHPSYVSKYFPAQGLFLAIGQKLTGHPAVGIWLSSALACAATCWMLQVWVGPPWALLGSLMMVVQFGVFSYWSQSYWGGMVAALGGALFFGAARRLWDHFAWQNAIWLAVGVVILVNSRPFEGLLAVLPGSLLLLWRFWRKRSRNQVAFWRSFALPAGAILLIGAAATSAYNRSITGSLWKTPYILHEEQYQESPPLIFMSLRSKLTYSGPQVQYYYEVREMQAYLTQRMPAGLMLAIARKLATWWAFYCGPLLTAPLVLPGLLRRGQVRYLQVALLGGLIALSLTTDPTAVGPRTLIDVLALAQIALLWFVFEDLWSRLAIATSTLLLLELFVAKFSFPHYFAPAACLILFLQVEGLRRIWHWSPEQVVAERNLSRSAAKHRTGAQAQPSSSRWRGLVILLPLACVVSLGLRVEGRIDGWKEDSHDPDRDALLMHDWSQRRADLDRWLEQQSSLQLVFVHYSSRHNVESEWVYSHADLVHSHVIWARDLGAEHDKLLLQQMPNRTVWLVEADTQEPQLVPYSNAARPAETLPEKTNSK